MAPQTTASLRWVVVTALLLAAAAHVPVTEHHMAEAPYMGLLFVAFAALCGAFAVLLAWEPTRGVLLAAAAVCGAGVLTYAATRLVAFPQLAHDVGHWNGPLGVLAVLSELVTTAAALAMVRRQSLVPQAARSRPALLPRHQGAH